MAITYDGVAKTNLIVYCPKTIQTKPDFFLYFIDTNKNKGVVEDSSLKKAKTKTLIVTLLHK
jgi:hypothetical protein